MTFAAEPEKNNTMHHIFPPVAPTPLGNLLPVYHPVYTPPSGIVSGGDPGSGGSGSGGGGFCSSIGDDCPVQKAF